MDLRWACEGVAAAGGARGGFVSRRKYCSDTMLLFFWIGSFLLPPRFFDCVGCINELEMLLPLLWINLPTCCAKKDTTIVAVDCVRAKFSSCGT